MLPDFRFLFAATVLCMSVLVFGLGAAALLRAAHEDVASNPTWRAPPEPRFAQQEATRTVLAVLSVQPPATESTATSTVAEADAATAPTESTIAPPSPEPGTTAAVTPPDVSPAEGAKPARSAETPARTEAQSGPLPARTEAPADAPAKETKTAATGEIRTAPAETASPSASEPVSSSQPSPTSQQIVPATTGSAQATGTIAILGGPAVTIEQPTAAAKAANAMLDRSLITKEQAKEHAKELRRMAARRARLARQAALVQQQADNPFAPHPLMTPAR
jgi:hypothetical protein